MDSFRTYHLKARPEGLPQDSHFELITTSATSPAQGQVKVRNKFLSLDPYMRGRMREGPSYIPAFGIGDALEGGAVGEVVESSSPEFPVGSHVLSMYGWRDGFTASTKGLTVLPENLDVPLSAWLGVLGMPGLTAWAGLFKVAGLKAGEKVFVSGAAGAVGSLVGQMAKLQGCFVVGSAGGPEKCAWLAENGFDAVIDYKQGGLVEQLAAAAPSGIDVYFDNVGGSHLEAALTVLRDFGRVAMCGAIEMYNASEPPAGPRNLATVIAKRIRVEGFIVTDYFNHMPAFCQEMAGWLQQGKVKAEETVLQGLEKTPEAFRGLFSGQNLGKMLVAL